MRPAQQGFGADASAGREVDAGLVDEPKARGGLQGGLEIPQQREAASIGRVGGRRMSTEQQTLGPGILCRPLRDPQDFGG